MMPRKLLSKKLLSKATIRLATFILVPVAAQAQSARPCGLQALSPMGTRSQREAVDRFTLATASISAFTASGSLRVVA
jgi:hypothetical protein